MLALDSLPVPPTQMQTVYQADWFCYLFNLYWYFYSGTELPAPLVYEIACSRRQEKIRLAVAADSQIESYVLKFDLILFYWFGFFANKCAIVVSIISFQTALPVEDSSII